MSESPSLYIDFSRLPPPNVVESIAYETLLQAYRDRVIALNPELEAATKLEQSPVNIILEAEAYGEMLVRQRVNAAARSSMLPFATGADLDNLASFFSQGRMFDVSRLPLVENPRPLALNREDWESDADFRRRLQLAPEAYASAGSKGGYIFHALSSDVTLRDATAIRLNDRGLVRVTLLNRGSDPVPSQSQIDRVIARLNADQIKPLTDTVWVTRPTVNTVSVDAEITLYPGPDQAVVMSEIRASLDAVRSRTSLLGRDLMRSQLISAMSREGVHNVRLISPAQDIICDPTQCVVIKDAKISVVPTRTE